MKTSKKAVTITPALAKDVSFNDKIAEVDSALRSRAALQREIKLKWAEVVQVLNKYEVTPPSRRVDADKAVTLAQTLTVYQPKPEIAADFKELFESGESYRLANLAEHPLVLRIVEAHVNGFKDFVDLFMENRAALRESPKPDDTKTTEARNELKQAVGDYIAALEEYDDTVTSVTNVKEYIGIVKDIADISIAAQGVKAKE